MLVEVLTKTESHFVASKQVGILGEIPQSVLAKGLIVELLLLGGLPLGDLLGVM